MWHVKGERRNSGLYSVSSNFPYILCLTAHHLRSDELDSIGLNQYNLGAEFCRKVYKNGGVSIFIHESIHFVNNNLIEYCKEKDLEACAVKLHLQSCIICITTIYRSPPGNFLYFF
jgi:hypothetical protein